MLTDQEVFSLAESRGFRLGEVFIAAGCVYLSEDAGDFQADSTFERFASFDATKETALVAAFRRFGVPEYTAIGEVEASIARAREWGELFERLGEILERHNKQDSDDDCSFLLVEDDYGSAQHKVECAAEDVLTRPLLSEVQALLGAYERRWEVIFALPAVDGKDHAFVVRRDAVIEHQG